MADLRIHPAIGVARVGNSDKFFIGPESPGVPGGWDASRSQFQKFKDDSGRVLRQAARFRIFDFGNPDPNGTPQEVKLGGGVQIEWRVHVANRKASFFTFNGQSGTGRPPYEARSKAAADAVEKTESRHRPAGEKEPAECISGEPSQLGDRPRRGDHLLSWRDRTTH